MELWTFILAVVTVVVAGQCFRSWLRYRERERRDQGRPGVEQEFERLRLRIEAVEAIVTDGGYDLRREIDRLDGDRRTGSGADSGAGNGADTRSSRRRAAGV